MSLVSPLSTQQRPISIRRRNFAAHQRMNLSQSFESFGADLIVGDLNVELLLQGMNQGDHCHRIELGNTSQQRRIWLQFYPIPQLLYLSFLLPHLIELDHQHRLPRVKIRAARLPMIYRRRTCLKMVKIASPSTRIQPLTR